MGVGIGRCGGRFPLSAPVRLVLDTNVVIDWLVFEDPFMAPLREGVPAVFLATDYAVGLRQTALGIGDLDDRREPGLIARRHLGGDRAGRVGHHGGLRRRTDVRHRR